MEVSKGTNKKCVYYQTYCNETGGRSTITDIVETVSILAGSIVLSGLFFSIAYEAVRTKSTSKKRVVSVLNDKWQKITVSAR
jgi:hypothetical protein